MPSPQPLLLPARFKYASVYVFKCESHVLRNKGFRELSYVVPRWTKLSGEVYGRSPGMKSLSDIKMINKVMETTIRGAQKTIDPPLQMTDESMVLPPDLRPGGLNYREPGSEPITPIITGSRVDFGFQFIDQIRNSIRDAFFINQLQLNDGPQMTATEVLQRTEESLRLLAPILGRQEFEFLRPTVDRSFNIMSRRNIFPEAPEELQGRELKVTYSSQIMKAQNVTMAQDMARAVEVVGPVFQAKPEVADLINGDEWVRKTFRLFNIPEEVLNKQDEIDQTREVRMQQQQEMQQREQELENAEKANKLAPVAQVAQQGG